MKNKNIYILLGLMLIFTQRMFSTEKIYIADILCFDSKGERYSLLQNPAIQIKKQLMEKYYDGLLEFENVHVQKTGETSSALDASKACITLGCQYLLYGYVRKNTNSWDAELKLFNKDTNSVIYSFFASDDVNHYERLITYLSENIYEYYKDQFNIKDKEKEIEQIRPFELKLPVFIEYWTPLLSEWNDVLVGVIGLNVGFELYPAMKKSVFKNHVYDYSFRPNLEYKIGLGRRTKYKATLNTFSFSLPVFFNIYNNEQSIFKLGIGPFYELAILNMVQKYDDAIIEIQNQGGLEFVFGYEYKINNIWSFMAETMVSIPLLEDSFLQYKMNFGFSYFLYNGESVNEE
ncbi:MAG: hypothetical protein MJ179_04930 [Treponema sp.]|nr:hypothetical protein [Treponema sp.]